MPGTASGKCDVYAAAVLGARSPSCSPRRPRPLRSARCGLDERRAHLPQTSWRAGSARPRGRGPACRLAHDPPRLDSARRHVAAAVGQRSKRSGCRRTQESTGRARPRLVQRGVARPRREDRRRVMRRAERRPRATGAEAVVALQARTSSGYAAQRDGSQNPPTGLRVRRMKQAEPGRRQPPRSHREACWSRRSRRVGRAEKAGNARVGRAHRDRALPARH